MPVLFPPDSINIFLLPVFRILSWWISFEHIFSEHPFLTPESWLAEIDFVNMVNIFWLWFPKIFSSNSPTEYWWTCDTQEMYWVLAFNLFLQLSSSKRTEGYNLCRFIILSLREAFIKKQDQKVYRCEGLMPDALNI